MVFRRSYKSDSSFLEKLSMGAAGTRQIHENLRDYGHLPIELERGSMSFKIWKKIKIKRVRVPDILCIRCARRVEARAKTKLEISMSHSLATAERGWDFGLRDGDLVGIVLCNHLGEEPTSWQASDTVNYVTVGDMRSTFANEQAIVEKPKGAQKGFELRVTWPSSVASQVGVVTEVTSSAFKYRRAHDKGTTSVRLSKKGLNLIPLLKVGDPVHAGQVVASVVPVYTAIQCDNQVDAQHYAELIQSSSLSDRYTAAKALSQMDGVAVRDALTKKMMDEAEHIYVRLEAAAGLMRKGDIHGVEFVRRCLSSSYLENRLEAVIVLGEVKGEQSCQLLIETLMDRGQDAEIRAGAACSLGELGDRTSFEALIGSFLAVEEPIRIEAARALAKLARKFPEDVVMALHEAGPSQRPGIAWALSKAKTFPVTKLLQGLVDEDSRQWIAYVLGTQEPTTYVADIERLKAQDPEVYFAVTVLWKIMSSWINGLEEY